jgi:subtilisin family serine protease
MTKFTVSLALCMVALIGSAMTAPSVGKVSKVLQRSLEVNNRVNIFISMKESVYKVLDEVDTLTFSTRGDKATAVFNTLTAHAAKSQKSVLEMLNSPRFFAIKVQSFWISNQVYVQGADAYLVSELANMDEVASIDLEAIITLDEPVQADPQPIGTLAEWGVDKIRSQEAWAAGFDGTGSVVGIIDTGARSTHEAIRDSYRGGTHSWFNPYSQTQQPGDGHGHGTHVTGTIAGSRASGVGVAPGAKWISCKGLQDNGSGTQAALLACGQFMACPHTYNGGSPNCALAPHSVSNSWGGGAGANWYDPAIRSWHSANIIPVFAMGNSGPSCGSANSPGDSQAGVLGIGATTATDAIASFSSRGPSSFSTQKPDISAPGNAVRSAGHTSDTAYTSMSGTSMACPHVAGVVSLIKGRNNGASYATVKQVLESTSDRNLVSGSQTCSGVPDTQFPNYTFGFGRVNALSAVQAF